MTKYIEASKLLSLFIPLMSGTYARGWNDAISAAIDKMPAADVIEVVRCKDCAIPHNRWTGCPQMNGTIMEPDDYCSYGKRKEGEG